MLIKLISSGAKAQRTVGGVFVSIGLHVVFIGGAVFGTLHAEQTFDKPTAEKLEFVTVKPPPPPPKEALKPPPANVVAAPPPPKGFQVLVAPIKIPDVLPNIDLSKKITDENDFLGKGVAGGRANGVAGGTVTANTADGVLTDLEVDQPVSMRPGDYPPHYPDALRAANVEGDVMVSFVVDTIGRPEMRSFKVLQSTHALFTQAVKLALENYQYNPAKLAGHKVRQLVQQPFHFSLSGR